MKTRFLQLLILLFISNLCFSQEVITIDFKTKLQPDKVILKKISEGDFYKIKINNINPNRYNVIVNSKDTIVTNKLEMPTFKDVSLDALTKLTSSFSSTVGLVGQFQELESSTNLKTAIRVLAVNFPRVVESNPINLKINTFSENSKNLTETLSGIKMNYDNAKMEFYKFKIDKYKEINTNNGYNVDVAFAKFENVRNSFSSYKENVNISSKEFETFINTDVVKAYLKVDANKNDKEKVEKITAFYKEAIEKINEFIEAVSAENVDKMLNSIVFLSNENSFESLPLQFRKEQTKVTIKFSGKTEEIKKYLQDESMSFYFPLPIDNYWSVGTSFYYAPNMKNERFSTIGSTSVDDITTYTIKKEDAVKEEFGMGAMLRYGLKVKKNLGYHLAFGPGVSIEKDIKPRLLLGGGFSLGNKHSIALDLGFVVGYVNRKSEVVDLTKTYTEKPQDLTVTKLDYSPYFSLGYLYKL